MKLKLTKFKINDYCPLGNYNEPERLKEYVESKIARINQALELGMDRNARLIEVYHAEIHGLLLACAIVGIDGNVEYEE